MSLNHNSFKPWAKSNEKDLAKYVIPNLAGQVAELELGLHRFDEESTPEGRRKIIEHIYNALRDRISDKKINYDREKYNYQDTLQAIRTPHEILKTPHEGTCLDLSVLFCGLCLYYDLLPLLIIVKGHAFVAVSLKYSRKRDGVDAWNAFGRKELHYIRENKGLLRDKAFVKKLVITDKEYLPIECTGFAFTEKLPEELPESRNRKNGLLFFEDAIIAGERHFNYFTVRDFEYALDIHYLHEQGIRSDDNNYFALTTRPLLDQLKESLFILNYDPQERAFLEPILERSKKWSAFMVSGTEESGTRLLLNRLVFLLAEINKRSYYKLNLNFSGHDEFAINAEFIWNQLIKGIDPDEDYETSELERIIQEIIHPLLSQKNILIVIQYATLYGKETEFPQLVIEKFWHPLVDRLYDQYSGNNWCVLIMTDLHEKTVEKPFGVANFKEEGWHPNLPIQLEPLKPSFTQKELNDWFNDKRTFGIQLNIEELKKDKGRENLIKRLLAQRTSMSMVKQFCETCKIKWHELEPKVYIL